MKQILLVFITSILSMASYAHNIKFASCGTHVGYVEVVGGSFDYMSGDQDSVHIFMTVTNNAFGPLKWDTTIALSSDSLHALVPYSQFGDTLFFEERGAGKFKFFHSYNTTDSGYIGQIDKNVFYPLSPYSVNSGGGVIGAPCSLFVVSVLDTTTFHYSIQGTQTYFTWVANRTNLWLSTSIPKNINDSFYVEEKDSTGVWKNVISVSNNVENTYSVSAQNKLLMGFGIAGFLLLSFIPSKKRFLGGFVLILSLWAVGCSKSSVVKPVVTPAEPPPTSIVKIFRLKHYDINGAVVYSQIIQIIY